ncbi:hypothetical protein MD484_g4173, partial [Candolleomyces efflorescens]
MSKPNIGSSLFHGAQNTAVYGGIQNTNVERDMHVHNHNGRSRNRVKDLEEHIAAGAMHNSAERYDAPKCHPRTRFAVQDELVHWIEHGEEEENPKKFVWVTGPAGGGKTAIMGSIADICEEKGIVACCFFFSSFAQSIDRRYKRCFVPTLAYQLVQHQALRPVGEDILSCVERDPAVFKKRVEVQFEQLLLQPLRGIQRDAQMPKVILIDGLDECQAEERHGTSRTRDEAIRANEADQTEILEAILKAANDPSSPFRFIIASRPEPAIQFFFTDTAHNITKKIFLDNKYNPDADMLLFVEAKFDAIRRRYHLHASWPPQDVKHTLVGNASGQFVYVATAMRFLEGSSGPPQELLNRIMALGHRDVATNPFALLDALYTHIFNSSPKPLLAARWLVLIFRTGQWNGTGVLNGLSARFIQLFLESSQAEASYVFRGLNSLVSIPPADDHTSHYSLFHKSLTDFLGDKSRCGSLYVANSLELYFTRYLQIWKDKGPATPLSEREKKHFLHRFFEIPNLPRHFEENVELYDVAWWVRSQDEFRMHPSCMDPDRHTLVVRKLFSVIHSSCDGKCDPVCKYVRTEMLKELQRLSWKTPRQKTKWDRFQISKALDYDEDEIRPPENHDYDYDYDSADPSLTRQTHVATIGTRRSTFSRFRRFRS